MMRSKKIILVVALIVAFLLVMLGSVQASSYEGLNIIDITGENEVEENEVEENEILNIDDEENEEENNVVDNSANGTMPQTGVAEDTALIVFIAVCLVSAIYAYTKVRNYKNI